MVSIIVPIYNAEKYIVKCVDSLLNQTYKNIEIILVNDGSNDSSGSLCESLKKYNSNIIVMHQENSGSGAARNNGLENATGEYIMFCDPDDWLPNDAVDKLLRAMENSDADLAIGFIKDYVYDKNENFIKEFKKSIFAKSAENDKEVKDSFIKYYDNVNFKSPCNKLYKKSIIENNKIRFPNIRRSQDIVFNNEYLKYTRKMEIVAEHVYCRRIIANSFYKKLIGDFVDSRVKVYYSYKNLISFWEIDSIESKRLLNKVLFEVIWSYYNYVIKNPEYGLIKKYKLLNDVRISNLKLELKSNKAKPLFDTGKKNLLYSMIYYDLKLLLIFIGKGSNK